MTPADGSIGRQIVGELGQVAKDVGKAMADIPAQVMEGSAKTGSNGHGDQEGVQLEQGQALSDDSQAQQQAGAVHGWKDALKIQLFGDSSNTQQRLAVLRRDLGKEVQAVSKQKAQQKEQEEQAEEQQKEMVKKQKIEQKKEHQKLSLTQRVFQFGKGETRGAKGN